MEFKNISRQLSEIAKNYDYQQPPDLLIKFQELMGYIDRLIRELLSYLKLPPIGTDSRGVANILQVLVVVAGVAAAVMILLLVASRLKSIERQRKLALGGMVVGESPLDSAGWLNLADELAAKTSYKEACRAVYMSVLHLLDERQVIFFSATKTNYEYFYALKKLPALADSFRQLADLVEEIWFGDKSAGVQDFNQARSLAGTLKTSLPAAVATSGKSFESKATREVQ